MKVKFNVVCQHGDAIRTLMLPGHYVVCTRCGGKGTHSNPNVDSHGLTAEDFEDEDFREGYFSGRFDVQCHECNGERVIGVVATERLPKALRKRICKQIGDMEADRAERAFEMRMAASGMEW